MRYSQLRRLSVRGTVNGVPESCSAYSPRGGRCGELRPCGRAPGMASVANSLPNPVCVGNARLVMLSMRVSPLLSVARVVVSFETDGKRHYRTAIGTDMKPRNRARPPCTGTPSSR